MNQSTAKILNANEGAMAIAASAARMSTQRGTALEIYAKSGDSEKDLNLIRKVLASGHKSVIEHQTISVAVNDVSVLVEQFVIEFRLASYTVKSRRYVDFSDAGYVISANLDGEARSAYCVRMERLFQDYQALLQLGIPKEDARFLLPYCLRSNFFMTVDARELIHMILAMLVGRGAAYEEIHQLGVQLKDQFDLIYPGAIDAELGHVPKTLPETIQEEFFMGSDAKSSAELLDAPRDAEGLLENAMAFSGRFQPQDGAYFTDQNVSKLLCDARPRELETLNYTFLISNISLACLTHFTRHRMQSLLIPSVRKALLDGNYVLPESIRANPEAEEIYRRAFREQTEAVRLASSQGIAPEILSYYAMSGHVTNIMLTINGRELLHFAKLRTCSRAQWEIRGTARQMLSILSRTSPKIFSGYGPSCAVTGKCPEGRMSCGHPVRIVNGCWQNAAGDEV